MTDETTDLRARVDGWLDGLPQPAAQPFVQQAIETGERTRRRRRRTTVLAVAAAVAAIGVTGALLRGPRTAPAPEPGGSTGRTPAPTAPTRSSGGIVPRPTTVLYPDGPVTWPAPGGGPVWVQSGVGQQPVTAAGRSLRDALLAAAPGTVVIGSGPAADKSVDAGISQAGPTGRTTDLRARVIDVDGPRIGLLSVRMTRGGLSDEPLGAMLDPCGIWPDGSPGLGLRDEDRKVFFGQYPARTCAVHRSAGSTFVRWEGSGRSPDPGGRPYTTRMVFTVRSDGTAVQVVSSTRVRGPGDDGPELRRPRDWAGLEQLAVTLPVPAGLGAAPTA
jgi:hypothetical protein